MDLDDLRPSVSVADRYGYIYHTVFTRPTDGKKFHYIGQHRRAAVDRRYYGSGTRLCRMVEKHGLWGNVKVFIVCWETSQQALNETEIWFIRQAMNLYKDRCINLCYREAHGRHTKALRDWMSTFHRGKTITAEHRAKITETYRLTPQHILEDRNRCRSEAMTGKSKPHSHRKKISAALLGHKLSEETKEKIRDKAQGRKRSAESIARQSASALGKKQSILQCPYCEKTGGSRLMKRWHFENCKSSPTYREGSHQMSATARKNCVAGARKRKPVRCPHCDVEGQPSNMRRWHFANCLHA